MTATGRRQIFGSAWRAALAVALTFAVIELLSSAIVFGYYALAGKDTSYIARRLTILAPFAKNPISDVPGIRYVGYRQSPSGAREVMVADPVLGWRNGGSIGFLESNDDGNTLAWYITNSQGFGSSGELQYFFQPEKPPSTFRIVMLGGSTVFGSGVARPTDNLPSTLVRALREKGAIPAGQPGSRIEVINAGVMGYYSAQELLYLQTELVHFSPDLVILYNGWNDFHSSNEIFAGGVETAKDRFRHPYLPLTERLNDSYRFLGSLKHFALASAVQLYAWVDGSAAFYLFRRVAEKALLQSDTRSYQLPAEIYYPKDAEIHARNQRDTVMIARDRGIRIAAFLQPIMGVDGREPAGIEKRWFEANPKQIENRRAFYADARRNLTLLQERFRADPGVCATDLTGALANVNERVYEDTGHLTLRGNVAVAEAIVAALTDCAVLERRPS